MIDYIHHSAGRAEHGTSLAFTERDWQQGNKIVRWNKRTVTLRNLIYVNSNAILKKNLKKTAEM